jgi:hypothetical protein
VKPKLLKSQLQVKGKKLVELQQKYTTVVNLKQAEPAVCALYRIGLAYKRFAQSLYDAPIPKELKALRRQDVIDEYKGQLAQLAAPPEQKAVEGLEYAMTKSREYGVRNECSRKAAEILAKYKPDQHGPPLEAIPTLAAAVPDTREGHGLVAALLPPSAGPAAAPEEVTAALPPLHSERREARRAEPEREAVLEDQPKPRAKPRPPPDAPPLPQAGDKDEDLLE